MYPADNLLHAGLSHDWWACVTQQNWGKREMSVLYDVTTLCSRAQKNSVLWVILILALMDDRCYSTKLYCPHVALPDIFYFYFCLYFLVILSFLRTSNVKAVLRLGHIIMRHQDEEQVPAFLLGAKKMMDLKAGDRQSSHCSSYLQSTRSRWGGIQKLPPTSVSSSR